MSSCLLISNPIVLHGIDVPLGISLPPWSFCKTDKGSPFNKTDTEASTLS